MKINDFDPSGVGLKNGNFIGLPFTMENAKIVLYSVPWDVTVSYADGTSGGPLNILTQSTQLDLLDPDVKDAWKAGIYFDEIDEDLQQINDDHRPMAESYIELLEEGVNDPDSFALSMVEDACDKMVNKVFHDTFGLLTQGKLVGLIGGDHSTPLGYYQALAKAYEEFGIFHFDAHMDMRQAYEDFTYSHASIMYNALTTIPEIKKIVQVGIRDYCEQEVVFAQNEGERVKIFFDHEIKKSQFMGVSFHEICQKIVSELPQLVHISFDIDVLDPKLCPHTGTPVPGGFEFNEVAHLLSLVVESGRKIIGFDLVETGGEDCEWDGNVGARIAYKLCNIMAKSQGLV